MLSHAHPCVQKSRASENHACYIDDSKNIAFIHFCRHNEVFPLICFSFVPACPNPTVKEVCEWIMNDVTHIISWGLAKQRRFVSKSIQFSHALATIKVFLGVFDYCLTYLCFTHKLRKKFSFQHLHTISCSFPSWETFVPFPPLKKVH